MASNFHKRSIGDRSISSIRSNITSRTKPKKKILGLFNFKKKQDGPKKKKWFWRFIKFVWPYALGFTFIGIIVLIGLFAWYSKDLPDPNKIMDRSVALSTKIYDRTGEVLLYEIHGPEKRTLVEIDSIPEYVVNATIAVEDKNFYNHKGISVWGIIRGQIMPRLQGKRAQGGSTLTQQFVKNAILTNERAVSRKIKEWILSFRIEQKYSKQEILQLYFNEIPYGSSAYGVESAAQYYFDKSAKDLTLAEAAILAALPQAPSYYSPYGSNKDALIGRQRTVLRLMEEQGYISAEELEQAKEQELVFKKRAENIKAPHFVLWVKEILEQKYGTAIIEQSGWKIITSLDWEAQQKAEAAIEEIAPKNLEEYEASNAALVSLDVETAEILAMVGSKDYFDDEIDGQVNIVTSSRQPGSSMKPLVYLAAFAKGYRPDTVLLDLVTNFSASGDPYIPHNYDLKERGPVTMRQALAGSLNIPAVKTLYLAGVQNVLDLADQFGYSTLSDRSRFGLSLVLGGGEVKLLEHVNAYGTFAREGVYKDIVPILKIEDSEGNKIEETSNQKGRRVIDKEPVYTLNNVLSDNEARAATFGANNYLTLGARPVAAKTGTTNDYRDAWTIGYTPEIVTGVWVGNNDNTEMKKGAGGSAVAAPIWNKFMRSMLDDKPISNFKNQELEKCNKVMICGEFAAEKTVEIDKSSGKLATEFTPYYLIEKKKYKEVHNILQYVNTNDPLGAPLDDPNNDPQYRLWEAPVLKWAEEEGYLTEEPPTESDDTHLAEFKPTIKWKSPDNNDDVKGSSFVMEVEASAPRGVNKVEYFIDDQKVGDSLSLPFFSYNYQINPFLSNGQHSLKAIAFDDLGNFKESIININLDIDNVSREFNLVWLDPSNGASFKQSDLPINLKLNIDKPNKVEKIDFYYLSTDSNSHWFNYSNPQISDISVPWGEGLTPGVYKLYVVIKDVNAKMITTPAIIVNVEEELTTE